jgi:tRNA pseudouridine55 synthase
VSRAPRSVGPDGIVVVDKPAGMTSHDVVSRVRRLAGTRKVGHAGTLDPMATGVLVVGVERATRLLTYLVGAEKSYDATIRLGASTVTDDAEGALLERAPAGAVEAVTDEQVLAGISDLTGTLDQVPSAVSAVKVDGRRAYARVRAGEEVVLASRSVTVSRFDLLAVRRSVLVPPPPAPAPAEPEPAAVPRVGDVQSGPVVDLDVSVDCSSGTYVRALARDLGAALGVGGHLTALRRTRVGPYALDAARTLEELGEAFAVLPIADAARIAFPARELDEDEARKLVHGQRLVAVGLGEEPTAAFAPDGSLVAIISETGPTARPLLVLQG